MIPVTARISPIRPDALVLHVEPGLTLSEIVARVMEHRAFPARLAPILTLTLNEDRIPRELWRVIRPKPGARIQVTPLYRDGGGGDGGGKGSIFEALVLVATLAASAIPGVGWIAGPIVGLVGSAALALFAPKPQATGTERGGTGPQLVAAGFAGNVLAPYEQIPTVLGRIRVAPYQLTDAWTRLNGLHQILRGVIGISGHVEWSEIRVNGALEGDAESVKIEDFNGDGIPPEEFPTFFEAHGPRRKELGITDRIGIELKKYDYDPDGHQNSPSVSALADQDLPENSIPKYYSLLTKDSPHVICINLQFPGGLYESDATTSARSVFLRIRMRLIGETTWRNLPELMVQGPRVEAFNFVVYISWEPIFDASSGNVTTAYESDLGSSGGAASWTADAYFDQGSAQADHCIHRNDMDEFKFSLLGFEEDEEELTPLGEDFIDHIGIFLNETSGGSTPWPKGKYEMQIKRSLVNNNTTGGWPGGGGDRDPFSYFDNSGTWVVTPRQKEMVDTIILHSVTYLWEENCLQAPDKAALAFELRNTQVDHLTALAETWATVYVPSGWNGYGPTRNPAALFRHVLTGETLNARPLHLELIDDERLAEWYIYCADRGIECNDVIESGSVDDALTIIARAGDAVIARSGRSWRVAIDKDRTGESPLVVFSPRNVRDLSIERTYEEVAHAIRATFLNEDNDNTREEIIVYDDDQNADTATRIQAVDYRGITKQERVEEVALRDLRKARLRRNTYTFETGKMVLNVDKGDLVGLAHDALDGFWGWGYTTKIIRAGGFITGVEIDAEVAIPSGIDDVYTIEDIFEVDDIFSLGAPGYAAITYRDASQVINVELISRGRTRELIFATPIADTALIDVECHVAIAGQSDTYRRCIVENIENGRDLTARVTLRDEAPAIFA